MYSAIRAVLLLLVCACGVARADSAGWQFKLEPYIWLPSAEATVDATVRGLPRRGGEPRDLSIDARTDPGNYLDNLEMAFMLAAEARYGRFLLLTDIMYVDFGTQHSDVRHVSGPRGVFTSDISRSADLNLSSTIWSLAAGYRVAESDALEVDLLAGGRYLNMDSALKLSVVDSTGRLDREHQLDLDQQVWAGIVGARGRLRLDQRWFVPWYVDAGAGDGATTWQALLGLGYGFGWGDVTFAIRALGYHFDSNDKDMDLTLAGPALGVSLRW